ncbi:hypothetical protein [Kineococcus rhizosphaerae]|uniref:Uncharacterized protein n=1 Tax=Kineococcus rhizosphaerae TaxID=559628 RepID=A0A2T0R8J1_9ACTN|nr:hypothetical protein [Kineococcus rhizosphaerae]PRY17486.1 hypothetical protein CLV37_102449 [Kineococcus rhizosphaerae]
MPLDQPFGQSLDPSCHPGSDLGSDRPVDSVLIDCDSCTVRPHACSECVVSVLLGMPGRPTLDAEEVGAVEVLAASGLVPPLRLATRRVG